MQRYKQMCHLRATRKSRSSATILKKALSETPILVVLISHLSASRIVANNIKSTNLTSKRRKLEHSLSLLSLNSERRSQTMAILTPVRCITRPSSEDTSPKSSAAKKATGTTINSTTTTSSRMLSNLTEAGNKGLTAEHETNFNNFSNP